MENSMFGNQGYDWYIVNPGNGLLCVWFLSVLIQFIMPLLRSVPLEFWKLQTRIEYDVQNGPVEFVPMSQFFAKKPRKIRFYRAVCSLGYASGMSSVASTYF